MALFGKVANLLHIRSSRQSEGQPVALEGEWLRFRDKGIVTLEMFQDERFSAHYVPDLFTPADLIKLFKHLLIIAPLSSTEYFMPSLLQTISPKNGEEAASSTIFLCSTSACLLPSWMCPKWSLLCSSSLPAF